MQDPVEGLDGRAGVEEGKDSQHRPQAPDTQASSQNSATEGDHGNFPQSCPQDSGSPAAPWSPAAPGSPAASGSQAAPGSPSPGSPVGSGAAAEEAAVVPHSEQAPLVPGPSGDTASTTGNRLLEFRWTTEDPVLFRISINTFLDQLSLVMRNIQRLEFVAVVKRGRGISRES